MANKNVAFSAPQTKYLVAESTRLGITQTELIRRILDEYIHAQAMEYKQ